MSRALEALAPAKVNLGLRIRARRHDGYHELESVFVPLDLADRVLLRVTASSTLSPVSSSRNSGTNTKPIVLFGLSLSLRMARPVA